VLNITISHSHHFSLSLLFSSQIVTKQSRSLTQNLHNKNGKTDFRNFGALTIHAEEIVASRSAVDMTFRCSHLNNKDVFSKSVCNCKTDTY
jgi:hypothetical protein